MEDIKDDIVEESENKNELQTLLDNTPSLFEPTTLGNTLSNVTDKIVECAAGKVNTDTVIERHSKKLAEIAEDALEAETEKQSLVIQERKADNKVTRQEIKNRLIELRTESKRLKREQKQVLQDQKRAIRQKDKDYMWQLYEGKLTKMKYTYVPNKIILYMLLFFDGLVGFFNGLGAVSTAIMKAIKWILIIVICILLLYAIPFTRTLLTGLIF